MQGQTTRVTARQSSQFRASSGDPMEGRGPISATPACADAGQEATHRLDRGPRALGRATRSTRRRRHPAGGTWWLQCGVPGSRSRTGRAWWYLFGLPREPAGCFCQDLPLDLQLAVLPAQADEFLSFNGGEPVLAPPVVTIGLSHPVPDGGLGRFELSCQLRWRASRPGRSDDLPLELLRIGWSYLPHLRDTSLKQRIPGVH